MQNKDYKIWHDKKSYINNDKVRPFFHEGEVWFCSLGENIGFEQDGSGLDFLRPVLIIKKFNNDVCWVIPLTKKNKRGRYYFSFKLKTQKSTAIISQIRLVDSKRFQYKFGNVSSDDLIGIKKKLMSFLT